MFSWHIWCFIIGTGCAIFHIAAASDCVTRKEFESRLLELQKINEALVKRVETLENNNHQNKIAAIGSEEEVPLRDDNESVVKDEAGNVEDEHGSLRVLEGLVNGATTPNTTMDTNNRLLISDKTSDGIKTNKVVRKLRRRSENKKNENTRFVVDEVAGTPVAFSVVLNATNLTSLGLKQIIKFDKIITNIDNVFDMRIGVFTAPISGYYVFSLSAMAPRNETQWLHVMRDGLRMFHVWAEGSFFNTATKTMVIQVNKGQEVWVQTSEISYLSRNVYGYEHTAFTGFLLYANES